jgi:hypothetical protein
MFCTDEEALERLLSPDNLINKLEVRNLHSRNTQNNKLNPMMATLAVETALLSTQQEAAEAFGVCQQDISHLTNKGKSIDRDKVKDSVGRAHSAALDIMLESISLLGPKLKDVKKATDLSRIAADMGRAVEKTTPREVAGTNLKVVVFQPIIKQEKDYDVIDA